MLSTEVIRTHLDQIGVVVSTDVRADHVIALVQDGHANPSFYMAVVPDPDSGVLRFLAPHLAPISAGGEIAKMVHRLNDRMVLGSITIDEDDSASFHINHLLHGTPGDAELGALFERCVTTTCYMVTQVRCLGLMQAASDGGRTLATAFAGATAAADGSEDGML